MRDVLESIRNGLDLLETQSSKTPDDYKGFADVVKAAFESYGIDWRNPLPEEK
jgi:hypothetical protein